MEGTSIPDDLEIQHKILIVDDEQDLIEPFEFALQEQGHQVRSTTDGKEAIRLLDLFEPDLLVTDIVMDDVDVLKLIAELRRSRPNIKILAISGNPHLLRLAARQGADHILPKPFRIGELNALVAKLFNWAK